MQKQNVQNMDAMTTDTSMNKNPAAVELGTKGGSVKSKKKAEAARRNGKLGGRPKPKTDL